MPDRDVADPNHPLDRPIWHALTSCHARWSRKHGRAAGYDPATSSFVATPDDSPECLADLHGLLLAAPRGALFTTAPLVLPGTLACAHRALAAQMVLPASPAERPRPVGVRTLTSGDAEAAQALVALTKPGPFGPRTLELGRYVGVFEAGALVAMAGERMRLPGHVEISAVCTHPGYRGRGLSRGLIALLAEDAFARGQVPFLHVFTDNIGAIAAYHAMGFATRRTMHLAVITAHGSVAQRR